MSQTFPLTFSKARLAFVAWLALASFAMFYQERTRTAGFLPLTASIFLVAAAVGTIVLVFLKWNFWRDLARAVAWLWMSATGAALFTLAGIATVGYMWSPASHITFRLVRLLLAPFVSHMVVQPNALRLGSEQFSVIIQGRCSGVEGMALLLIVGSVWLLLFQEELRFPQAFVLLPLGAIALFLMNAIRLTALILIGNAGAPDVAADGFHSQAGWMAFILVAFGSSVVARRSPWVSRWTPPPRSEIRSHPATAFLLPFLILLAAGMISRASSSSFEWMYPIRFFAPLIAFWFFRRSYSNLDWRCGVLAPAVGIAAFVIWLAVYEVSGGAKLMPAALAGAPALWRYCWITLRILGAVITVPVAEELAFRGYVARRLMSPDFESVPFQSLGWIAVLGSSLLFGVAHGAHWILASVAGLLYALLIRRTGRIGDAIIAHAVTNALLAAVVLTFGQWQLW